jgi:hypothetical protein
MAKTTVLGLKVVAGLNTLEQEIIDPVTMKVVDNLMKRK